MKLCKLIFIVTIFIFSSNLFSQDYVFVHGWTNDGSLWDNTKVKQLIQNEFNYSRILQPSLNGTASASTQSANLRDFLNNNNVNNAVAISFSMGGMNTRYHLRRQYDSSQLQRINYHFTFGTPHQGSYVANNIGTATNVVLLGAASALWPGYLEDLGNVINIYYTIPASALVAGTLISAQILRAIIDNAGGPALDDLKVGSSAVNYINGTNNYESNVVKVGIACKEYNPVFYRLAAGSFQSITEDDVLQSVQAVLNYKLTNISLYIARYIDNPAYLETLVSYIATYAIFANTDYAWRNYVVQSNESDGVVPKAHQIYPNYNLQYYPEGAAHTEQKNHDRVIEALKDGLRRLGPTPPNMPTGLTATVISGTQINLNWQDNSDNETGFAIERSSETSGNWQQINNVGTNVTTYVDNGVIAGGMGIYYYRVRAYNNYGSSYSNTVFSSASIIGPSFLSKGETGTWTAYPSGGSYQWWFRYLPSGSWSYVGASQTYSRSMDINNFELKVSVTKFGITKDAYQTVSYSVGGCECCPFCKEGVFAKGIPKDHKLHQNSPNPFNPVTTIRYELPVDSYVKLKIYDMLGREVMTLVDGVRRAGYYEVMFDASKLSNGIYFYKLTSEKFAQVNKMLLMK